MHLVPLRFLAILLPTSLESASATRNVLVLELLLASPFREDDMRISLHCTTKSYTHLPTNCEIILLYIARSEMRALNLLKYCSEHGMNVYVYVICSSIMLEKNKTTSFTEKQNISNIIIRRTRRRLDKFSVEKRLWT
jgi:hypothetical protein